MCINQWQYPIINNEFFILALRVKILPTKVRLKTVRQKLQSQHRFPGGHTSMSSFRRHLYELEN